MGDTHAPPTEHSRRLYPLHHLLLDLLRAHPDWTPAQLAAELALSETWVGFMINTDAFRAALSAPPAPAAPKEPAP